MATSKPRITVFGAGAFGGWTALHLLRRGAEVTLIDAHGPGNSRASSGGDSRLIRGFYGPNGIYVEMVARAFALWRELQVTTGRKLFHDVGGLWLFGKDQSYATGSIPHLEKMGLPFQSLDLNQVAQDYPAFDLSGVAHAYFEPYAGYLLARRACVAVQETFIAEGGTYETLAVQPGAVKSGRMDAPRLSSGELSEADTYVFACGPWMAKLFPQVLAPYLFVSRQSIHFFGLPAGDRVHRDLPTWVDFGEDVFYGVPNGEFRGFKVAHDQRGAAFDPDVDDRVVTEDEVAAVRGWIQRRLPQLKNPPLLETRVCQYTNTVDGHFIIDRHPEAENVWFATGGCGHGFKLGPVVGERLADNILGLRERDAFFAYDRLKGKEGNASLVMT